MGKQVSENIRRFRLDIPAGVRLVAVSKTKPTGLIMEAYQAGQRVFGENRVQELVAKQPALPGDIEWHFIGHLQTNKVRQVLPCANVIESVDRLKLFREITREAARADRRIECYLQFHIAEEETKYGLDLDEAVQIIESGDYRESSHVAITGVMGMATFTDDMEQVRKEFRTLRTYFETIRAGYFSEDPAFREISMGMSGDYKVAIEEGATNIRIGSALFGERDTH